jgi:hypothetical protein
MEPWLSPAFFLAPHRSGGTLLARLVNTHPGIVIWGEHAGILNKLAEIDQLMTLNPIMEESLDRRGLDAFVDKPKQDFDFSPWLSPVTGTAFREFARNYILRTFSYHLLPGQRWGTKEIRYHSLGFAQFVHRLFPGTQFVLLHRDPVELCVSNVMAEWSLRHLDRLNAGASDDVAAAVVSDCAYALAAIDWGMDRIQGSFNNLCLTVEYAALRSGCEEEIERIFTFLSLPVSNDVIKAAECVLSIRSGETPSGLSVGKITEAFVRSVAPRAVAEARMQIAAAGPDYGRLRSKRGVGKYSFLVGDHFVASEDISSVF